MGEAQGRKGKGREQRMKVREKKKVVKRGQQRDAWSHALERWALRTIFTLCCALDLMPLLEKKGILKGRNLV